MLVVAPHPDDETLGAGGLIQRVLDRGGSVQVLFVTNGDGFRSAVLASARHRRVSQRDFLAYGRLRRREAIAALQVLGSTSIGSTFLGFPDDGIDNLWAANWSDAHPYRSPFTDSDRPPYNDSARRGIEYSGVDLERVLGEALRTSAPDWVVIPDPRDRHPDHCTTGGFVLAALNELRHSAGAPFSRIAVLTYLVHYPEYPGSPLWQQVINGAGIGGSSAGHESLSHTSWMHFDLSPAEIARKREALGRYRSQMAVMDSVLALFVRPQEVFGHLSGAQLSTLPREYATRWRPHRSR